MRKKLFTFLLALVTSVGVSYAAPDDSGSCGANVTYSFNGATGEMTITGTGPMTDFASASNAPWYSYKNDITSVTITDGVTSVGSYSFGYYGNLVTVTIGNDVETIGYYAFGDCYKFTTLNLGNSVKHIGDRAFMWAKVLTGFTLPSTLETIGERAFLQNKVITSLTIPSNVTSIGESAFMYCAALTSITVEATTPPTLGATVFEGVPTSIPLYVPNGSVASYTAAAQWNAFNIQGYDPAPGGGSTPVSAVEGQLSGAFSINSDGDYIAFSKGNLQYHCTNHVWQFATNQYDIIGNDNANISDSYDGWVDLFGYGTGNNPTLTITNYSSFSTFTDWGVNAISNGGNEANLWRTLTRDEWAYLFNSRTNASSKYGMATVANVPGVIVLPDVYEGSAINTDHDGWGNNIISSGDWAAYETAGAVFLPVAGYREGTTVDNLGSYGFYWSSTPEDAMFSKKLSLDQYLVEPEGYGLRYQGLSVRLVQATSAPSSGSEPEPTEDAIVIVTKTKQSSYTQSTVTISCAAIGDSDGFTVSIYGDKTATITNSDASKIISKIELVPGYSESYHSYVRANGETPASSSESLITFTNVNSNNVTLSITNEYIQIKEVRITLADNGGSTPAVDPTPTPSATAGIFANCYDCWRDPEYPTISGQCRLYNFGNPYVGNNNPSGPWKLEFVGNYDSSSSEYDSNIVGNYAASQYGKTPEQMEVYRLYQWQNGAYQPVAYGVLYAYANESNPVEHAAFFEAGGHWGCYFTDNTHSGGDDFNITFNEDASTGFADLHGSTPAPAPTAAVIGDPNNASEVETFLTTYDGQTIDELIIDRPVLNNMYNTLCLPFDMNATQIAASSLNGVEIREFTGASVEGTTLNLSVGDPVNAVVAGRPYFVKFSAASQLDDLHFEDVTINNALLDNMAVTFDGVTFKGTFTPFVMPNGLNFQGGYLFLGQNNQLFWPNTSNPLKPFRAYFYVNVESSTPGNAPKYRGMPARIVEGKNVTTGVENAQSANQSTKVIVNGQLIIIKNDVHYNAQGQIVK